MCLHILFIFCFGISSYWVNIYLQRECDERKIEIEVKRCGDGKKDKDEGKKSYFILKNITLFPNHDSLSICNISVTYSFFSFFLM